ncbi:MAG: 1-phosphofructokinase family hexose kinase [Tepidisphaeraceae bacterium]|jgi:tagatose 6-phosphate kinase
MILCIGTTPAAQRVMVFRSLAIDVVNRAVQTLDGFAGKSINVAKVLHALGEQPLATGFLGGDRGEQLRQHFDDRGIEHEFVTVRARTRQCITVIDEGAGTHTELVEESRAVEPGDFEKLVAIIRRRIGQARAVIMSGTVAPGGPTALYRLCTELAHEKGIPAVADAAGVPLMSALEARPSLVKPNHPELAATAGRALPDDAAVMQAMRQLSERGAERVVVTAGKNAALAFDGKTFWRICPPRVTALNPIGSGDSFTAALTLRLLRGDDLGECCRWGSAAGAANALTWMAGEVRKEDVEELAGRVSVERIDSI